MKTTLDQPDEILKNVKAAAALRGETLRDYVAATLESRLSSESSQRRATRGWRSVLGTVRPADVVAIDQAVSRDLETIEPDD